MAVEAKVEEVDDDDDGCRFFFFFPSIALQLPGLDYRGAARTAISQQQHQRSLARSRRRTGEASFEGPRL